MARFRSDPAPVIAPVVVSPACLAAPVEPGEVQEPPMPDAIQRPAGQPSASNWDQWIAYEARRRERAELAGLFFQGERDQLDTAYGLTAEQLRQCNAWARTLDGSQ